MCNVSQKMTNKLTVFGEIIENDASLEHSREMQPALLNVHSRLSPSGQITNAGRSSSRSIFFSVEAIAKAIKNAIRPPFRTTVIFCGKMTSLLSSLQSNDIFSIYRYDHSVLRVDFYIEKTVTYVFHTCTMRTLQTWSNNTIIMW